jgi:hypothetical protein
LKVNSLDHKCTLKDWLDTGTQGNDSPVPPAEAKWPSG